MVNPDYCTIDLDGSVSWAYRNLDSSILERDFVGDKETEFSKIDFAGNSEYVLAGHGKQTNEDCGKHRKQVGCLNVEAHNAVRLLNPNLPKDSAFVKPVYHSCDKPTCPICFKYGWAVRLAVRMESRLREASKRLGLPVEHIVASVPEVLYGLSLEDMRAEARKALLARGVIGGSMIVHMFRYHRRDETFVGERAHWFFSPHIHALAFIGGSGYAQCRACKDYPSKCRGCAGFEGVTRRCYEREGGRSGAGWIVKVLGKRKTVGGTCWYQLTHCSIRRGSKKSHADSWFGAVSYRRMKLESLEGVGVKHKCPLCGGDLVRVRYLGVFKNLHLDRRGQVTPFYDEDGKPLWEIVSERKFKGG